MPSMPYVVTQGDICTALENAYNFGHPKAGLLRTAAQTKLDALVDLRNNVAVGSCGDILSDEISTHIDEHWFGLPAPEPGSPRFGGPTGWWVNWSGPAEEIAREGIIAALEVSLGLNPGEDLADAALAKKNFPMDFSWICPVPRFEIWVGWRSLTPIYGGNRDGVVTVTMATPGYGNFFTSDPDSGIEEFRDLTAELVPVRDPMIPYPANGHIVVGSELTTTIKIEFPILGGGSGLDNQWKIVIGAGSQGSTDVVTHAPLPLDGIEAHGLPNPVVTK